MTTLRINNNAMLHIDCEVTNCDVEFYINDIPVSILRHHKTHFYTCVAHRYVIEGSNQLKMVIAPNKTPSISQQYYTPEENQSLAGASATMRLVLYPVGATPGERDNAMVLSEISWAHQASPPQPRWPVITQAEQMLQRLFNRPWYWQRATPVSLSKDRGQLIKVVERLHQIFEQGEGDLMAKACAPYLQDQGLAIPHFGEPRFRQGLIESVNDNRQRQQWVKPLVIDELDFRLCAEGKLVQLIDKNWAPTIRTLPQQSGEEYPLNIFLGRYQNDFYVM